MRKGTNIETRDWYALYASGYFPSEMLSVNRVDETNNVQSTSAGISGQIGVTVNGEPDSFRFGASGASSGKSVMIACTGGSVSAYGWTDRLENRGSPRTPARRRSWGAGTMPRDRG